MIEDMFNETANVHKVTRIKQNDGSWSVIWGVNYIVAMPCRVQALRGDERFRFKKQEVDADFKLFCLPQSSDITEDNRIEVNSRIFDIVFVDKWDLAGHHWRIFLNERK